MLPRRLAWSRNTSTPSFVAGTVRWRAKQGTYLSGWDVSRRIKATLVLAGLVLALLGAGWGATALGRWHGAPAWSLSLLLAAGAASTAAGRKRLPAATGSVMALWRRPIGTAGVAERVRDAVPADFWLHPAARVDGKTVPVPNVVRDEHPELVNRIREGGLIVIQGDSAAGKSHLSYWAAREAVPGWSLVRCTTETELAALRGKVLGNALVLLDDLERFLTPGGLTESLLAKLCPRGASVTVLATLRSDVRAALTAADGGSAAAVRVLRLADHTVTLAAKLSDGELVRARELAFDSRIHAGVRANPGAGFGPAIAGGPAAVARWQLACSGGEPVAGALISAAVDLRRTGLSGLLPRSALDGLWQHYLPAGIAANRLDLSTVEEALAWAAHSESGTEPCLRLHSDGQIAVFDYLIDHGRRSRIDGTGKPVRNEAWLTASAMATVEQLSMFAAAALFDGRVDVATGVYSAGADAHDPDCLNIMGAVAHARGDHAEAESYLRQEVDLGDRSVYSLASVLAEQKDRRQEAEALLRHAADSGDEAAEYALGVHLAHQDECEQEAEAILRRFADSDRSSALVELGILIARQPGREAEAEAILRRARPMSDAEIICAGLPMILNTNRRMAEQTAVMRRAWAAEGGENLDALYNLGWLIECQEERQQEAEALYRRCVELGDPRAAYRLGSMLWRQPGHETEVEAAFRMAAANGMDNALYDLGALLGREHIPGYGESVESTYREAAASGNAEGTLLLALLLADDAGREDEAELYFRQAILSDDVDTKARYGLGLLFLLLDGRDEELGTLIGDLDHLDSRRAKLLRELRTMRDQAAAPVSPSAHTPSSAITAPDRHSYLKSSPSQAHTSNVTFGYINATENPV